MSKPQPLTPDQAKRSLVGRFGKVADRLRQIATRLGARPYRVFLVHTKWSGEERGEGSEREVSRVEILPTPKLASLDSVAFSLLQAGNVPVGSVKVTEVSTEFTLDQLQGLMVPGAHADRIPEPYGFYYEVVEDGRGDPQPQRAKFRLMNVPNRDAENVQWTFMLERVGQDNLRSGKPATGLGIE